MFLNHPERFILSLISVAGHRIARSRDDIGRAATGAKFAAGARGSSSPRKVLNPIRLK